MRLESININIIYFLKIETLLSSTNKELIEKALFINKSLGEKKSKVVVNGKNIYETEVLPGVLFKEAKLPHNIFLFLKTLKRNPDLNDYENKFHIELSKNPYDFEVLDGYAYPFLIIDFNYNNDNFRVANNSNYDIKILEFRNKYLQEYLARCNKTDKILKRKKIKGYRYDKKDESEFPHIHFKNKNKSTEFALNLIDIYFENNNIWKHDYNELNIDIPKVIKEELNQRFKLPGDK